MTLRYQLSFLLNKYLKGTKFIGDLPKWHALFQMGELCLSDSDINETQKKELMDALARLKKNVVNPKPIDVSTILKVTNFILTQKGEALPQGTVGEGEEVILG